MREPGGPEVAVTGAGSRLPRGRAAAQEAQDVGSAVVWLRRLLGAALAPGAPSTPADVTAVLGRAAGASGALLWEEVADDDGELRPSLLSSWLDPDHPRTPTTPLEPDVLTRTAMREACLALADPGGARAFGLPVQAALPLPGADGRRGALTILGDTALSDAAFDVVAELVDVLPDVLTTMRERRTLALVRACGEVLHRADVESPDTPLSPERLHGYLEEICLLVAGGVGCREVSMFLRQPTDPDGCHQLVASSTAATAGRGASDATHSPAAARGGPADVPEMEVPLQSGDQVWGRLRCRGADGPPFRFTSSDLSQVQPVAAQLSQYWSTWLSRRTVAAEIDSWRRLAEGITTFNRLLAEELRSGSSAADRRQQLLARAALTMVQDVVPESSGAVVTLVPWTADEAATPLPVDSAGLGGDVDAPGSELARRVFAELRQDWTTHPRELAREGLQSGWLLCTPIRVGQRGYGVLKAFGPGSALPCGSPQVYEIVGDQLGLYRHLENTMSRLQDAQHTLRSSLRGQAEAMEDLKHQLVSPLRSATQRTERVLRSGRLDARSEAQLRAVRGLCRKASLVAMSAGVFAALSKGQLPSPRAELLGVDDLVRMLIAAADDAQLLSDARRGTTFDVDRESLRQLGRRLVDVDPSFLQQCVSNLLDNAGKYSYSGTRVAITADLDGSCLGLGVTSRGYTLDEGDVGRALQRNWRGKEARNATGEGSGLGLWIVDHLMRAMKGRVEITVAGDTTTVRLWLPVV